MNLEPGIIIDASNQSADTLNLRIVDLAYSLGWVVSGEDKTILNEFRVADYNSPDSEALNDIANECVDWLNERSGDDNMLWVVEDNSLYLQHVE